MYTSFPPYEPEKLHFLALAVSKFDILKQPLFTSGFNELYLN
jgi:hypothetical protein